jgi:hypothetical protein
VAIGASASIFSLMKFSATSCVTEKGSVPLPIEINASPHFT